VSGSGAKSLRLWDAATGTESPDAREGHSGAVRAVAIGRIWEHDVIVSGSTDRTLLVRQYCSRREALAARPRRN
jgi:WD40 repeat protein